ncbi:MAG: hypothetical protein M1820_003148 [Bogoriella megaspora]|nr:MAG: hypothetical protein M1820_003148 [Bogoriella megaspora]
MASAEALKKWLVKIREYGFCFVDGCPPTAEATQALLERIAFIRQTHYGGYWESTADMQSIDTAYTNLSLDVHTDTTYFSDPVGLEMFHILSHEGGEGGETILVDGFRAAAALLNQDLGYYNLLSSVKLHHHASGDDGINFVAHRGFPVLELDDETSQLMRIRWNNADRAAIDCPVHMKDQWYHAAQAFHNHLTQAGSEIKLKLVPGRPLIFDNWRVLHGRTSFTGNRRLGGGYINHDDFISRFKQLHYQKAQILNATLTG